MKNLTHYFNNISKKRQQKTLNDIFKEGRLENTKHDNIIKSLLLKDIKDIDTQNDTFYIDGNYYVKSLYQCNRLNGEVDLLMIEDNYILNFEVKSNPTAYGRRKALKQLKRTELVINKIFPNKYRIFNFYISGYFMKSSDKYKVEWISKSKMRNRKNERH